MAQSPGGGGGLGPAGLRTTVHGNPRVMGGAFGTYNSGGKQAASLASGAAPAGSAKSSAAGCSAAEGGGAGVSGNETEEFRTSGHELIGARVRRLLFDDKPTRNRPPAVIGFVDGAVSGWLPAESSDFVSEITQQPAALWHVSFDNPEVGAEDLEEFEVLEAVRLFRVQTAPLLVGQRLWRLFKGVGEVLGEVRSYEEVEGGEVRFRVEFEEGLSDRLSWDDLHQSVACGPNKHALAPQDRPALLAGGFLRVSDVLPGRSLSHIVRPFDRRYSAENCDAVQSFSRFMPPTTTRAVMPPEPASLQWPSDNPLPDQPTEKGGVCTGGVAAAGAELAAKVVTPEPAAQAAWTSAETMAPRPDPVQKGCTEFFDKTAPGDAMPDAVEPPGAVYFDACPRGLAPAADSVGVGLLSAACASGQDEQLSACVDGELLLAVPPPKTSSASCATAGSEPPGKEALGASVWPSARSDAADVLRASWWRILWTPQEGLSEGQSLEAQTVTTASTADSVGAEAVDAAVPAGGERPHPCQSIADMTIYAKNPETSASLVSPQPFSSLSLPHAAAQDHELACQRRRGASRWDVFPNPGQGEELGDNPAACHVRKTLLDLVELAVEGAGMGKGLQAGDKKIIGEDVDVTAQVSPEAVSGESGGKGRCNEYRDEKELQGVQGKEDGDPTVTKLGESPLQTPSQGVGKAEAGSRDAPACASGPATGQGRDIGLVAAMASQELAETSLQQSAAVEGRLDSCCGSIQDHTGLDESTASVGGADSEAAQASRCEYAGCLLDVDGQGNQDRESCADVESENSNGGDGGADSIVESSRGDGPEVMGCEATGGSGVMGEGLDGERSGVKSEVGSLKPQIVVGQSKGGGEAEKDEGLRDLDPTPLETLLRGCEAVRWVNGLLMRQERLQHALEKDQAIECEDDGTVFQARVCRVDERRARVLVHFQGWSARHDKWVPLTSRRIRIIPGGTKRDRAELSGVGGGAGGGNGGAGSASDAIAAAAAAALLGGDERRTRTRTTALIAAAAGVDDGGPDVERRRFGGINSAGMHVPVASKDPMPALVYGCDSLPRTAVAGLLAQLLPYSVDAAAPAGAVRGGLASKAAGGGDVEAWPTSLPCQRGATGDPILGGVATQPLQQARQPPAHRPCRKSLLPWHRPPMTATASSSELPAVGPPAAASAMVNAGSALVDAMVPIKGGGLRRREAEEAARKGGGGTVKATSGTEAETIIDVGGGPLTVGTLVEVHLDTGEWAQATIASIKPVSGTQPPSAECRMCFGEDDWVDLMVPNRRIRLAGAPRRGKRPASAMADGSRPDCIVEGSSCCVASPCRPSKLRRGAGSPACDSRGRGRPRKLTRGSRAKMDNVDDDEVDESMLGDWSVNAQQCNSEEVNKAENAMTEGRNAEPSTGESLEEAVQSKEDKGIKVECENGECRLVNHSEPGASNTDQAGELKGEREVARRKEADHSEKHQGYQQESQGQVEEPQGKEPLPNALVLVSTVQLGDDHIESSKVVAGGKFLVGRVFQAASASVEEAADDGSDLAVSKHIKVQAPDPQGNQLTTQSCLAASWLQDTDAVDGERGNWDAQSQEHGFGVALGKLQCDVQKQTSPRELVVGADGSFGVDCRVVAEADEMEAKAATAGAGELRCRSGFPDERYIAANELGQGEHDGGMGYGGHPSAPYDDGAQGQAGADLGTASDQPVSSPAGSPTAMESKDASYLLEAVDLKLSVNDSHSPRAPQFDLPSSHPASQTPAEPSESADAHIKSHVGSLIHNGGSPGVVVPLDGSDGASRVCNT